MSKFTEFAQDIKKKNIISATIGLLNACPSRCVYCRKYLYPKDEINIGKLFNVIQYLHSQGLQTITFTGGEPLLYKNFIEVLKFCNSLDIQTSIITTLIPKTNLEDVAKLCTRIHVSIDSANKELYFKLRGVDALDVVKENLIKVNSIRKHLKLLPVRISSVISNENYNTIIQLYELAKETESKLNYYFVHTYEKFFLNDIQYKELQDELNRCIKFDEMYHISNASDIIGQKMTPYITCKSKTCTLPYIYCEIAPNGNIYPCCNLCDDNSEYDSTSKYAYGTIYSDDLDSEFKKRFNQTYDINKYCNGCMPHLKRYIDEVNNIILNKSNLRLFI